MKRRHRWAKSGLFVLFACVLPRSAAASSISDELLVGANAASGTTGAMFARNRLSTVIDVHEQVFLRASMGYARYGATDSSDALNVFSFSGGVGVQITDHWSVGIDGNVSPKSSSRSVVPTVLPVLNGNREVEVNATIETETTVAGFGAYVEYDAEVNDDVELATELSLGATSFALNQFLPKVEFQTGREVSRSELEALCGTRCPPAIDAILQREKAAFWQLRATLASTMTIHENTDVGLSVSGYAYTSDPREAAQFRLGTFGQGTVESGLPLAPLLVSVRPEFTQRLGDWSLGASASWGHYKDNDGNNFGGDARVAYKVSKALRFTLGGGYQVNLLSESEPLHTYWGSFGARVRW
ncbi:MAG: hypothetical protein KBF88_07470 [Polyangiaceae bacterium]|nr:hypothetical protein [Polyangiaceae bacterium]